MKFKLFATKYLNPNKTQGMCEDVPIPANEHILLLRVKKPPEQMGADCACWLQQRVAALGEVGQHVKI